MIQTCPLCARNYDEKDMEISHDVPAYLFSGFPNERRNKADKFGRHFLCKRCHKIYENYLRYRLFLFCIDIKEEFWRYDRNS